VISEGEIKVSDKVTLRRVALVQSLGFNLLSVSQLLDEGFEVSFQPRAGTWAVPARPGLHSRASCRPVLKLLGTRGTSCRAGMAQQIFY
jgi:hypothetical protein